MSYVLKESVQEIDGVKYRLQIQQDEGYESPRDWDGNLGTMVCFHSRYDLGDKHNYNSVEDFLKYLIEDVYSYSELYDVLYPYFQNEYKNLRYEFDKENDEYVVVYDIDGVTTRYDRLDCDSDERVELLDAFREIEDDMMMYFVENEYTQLLSENELLEIVEKSNKYVILPLYLYDHSGITMNTSGFHCNWDSGQVGWIYASKKTFIDETGYTQDELFSTDKNRMPKLRELVKLKGYDDNYGCNGFGKVIFINKDIVTVDYDFHKSESFKSQDNIITVSVDDIVEVKSDSAKEILIGEVETYDQYLTGEVYGFIIEKCELCECCGNGEWEHVDSCWGFYGTESIKDMKEHVEEKFDILFDNLK